MQKIISENIKELLENVKELKKGILVYNKKEYDDVTKISTINSKNWDKIANIVEESDDEDTNKKVKALKVEVINTTSNNYSVGEQLLISSYGGLSLIHDDDTLEELILIEDKEVIAVLK